MEITGVPNDAALLLSNISDWVFFIFLLLLFFFTEDANQHSLDFVKF